MPATVKYEYNPLSEVMPGLFVPRHVMCFVKDLHGEIMPCDHFQNIEAFVVHLNDDHAYSFEKIASILEARGLNVRWL